MGGGMRLGGRNQADADAVPLHSAVLCMNCECVTGSSSDECVVCGSRSLFSLEKLLGGTQASLADRPKGEEVTLFSVDITIGVKQIEPAELSAVVEGITNLIVPTLVQGQAHFHINVEPAAKLETGGARAA